MLTLDAFILVVVGGDFDGCRRRLRRRLPANRVPVGDGIASYRRMFAKFQWRGMSRSAAEGVVRRFTTPFVPQGAPAAGVHLATLAPSWRAWRQCVSAASDCPSFASVQPIKK